MFRFGFKTPLEALCIPCLLLATFTYSQFLEVW